MRNMTWLGVSGKAADQKSLEASVDALGPTDFDAIFINFLHIQANGTITLNATPIDQVAPYVAAQFKRLKTGFPVKKKIIASIGGWGSESDYQHLGQNVPAFAKSFGAFAKQVGIDGIDIDFEGFPYDEPYTTTIIDTINQYATVNPGSIVTLTPYVEQDFWTTVMQGTANKSGGNNVSWLNVMFYAGISNTPPSYWNQCFPQWVAVAGAPGTNITQQQAPGMIAVGCYAGGTAGTGPNAAFQPQDLTTGLQNILPQYPTMGGAFNWCAGLIQGSEAQWASAVTNATKTAVKAG